jgi:hypothetical protein
MIQPNAGFIYEQTLSEVPLAESQRYLSEPTLAPCLSLPLKLLLTLKIT